MKKSSAATAVANNYAHFINKAYQLTKHHVVVEDVIAEGIYFFLPESIKFCFIQNHF
jgi:hypothetical protein